MPNRETDSAGQIITPVDANEAARGFEITVLRQMGDNIAAQTRAMDRLGADLKEVGKDVIEVRERVIRLEEQKTHAEVATVKADLRDALARLDTLERDRDREDGARSVWSWLSKNAPWLVTTLLAMAAGFGIKAGLIK